MKKDKVTYIIETKIETNQLLFAAFISACTNHVIPTIFLLVLFYLSAQNDKKNYEKNANKT